MENQFFFEIFIPSYRQQDTLLRCLKSLNKQEFKSFQVTIVDDASGECFEEILSGAWNFPINLKKNRTNKGAVANMIYCMQLPSESPYVMVFHEDDLMHPGYLQTAYSYLIKNINTSLFISTMAFYNKASSAEFENINALSIKILRHPKELISEFFLSKSISLASCIFKKTDLDPHWFNLSKYSMLADRPFMCSFLENNKIVAFADGNFIIANDHSESDGRWNSLRKEHLQNILTYYRKYFNRSNKADKYVLKVHLTRFVMEVYTLLEVDHKPGKFSYVFKNVLIGNISLKYYLLLYPKFRTFVERLKGIK